MDKKINGVISALPTPFLNGKVDYESLEKLIQFQINNGVHGFVVNGTTAESPTLKWDEVEQIYKVVKNQCLRNEIIILGTGSNSTEETIEKSQYADKWEADAALVVVPYYNKPPQRGLVAHFTAVANSIKSKTILYNVPGRTITTLTADSVFQLSKAKNIVAIKEATGDLQLAQEIKSLVSSDFTMLSGDDGTYIDFLKCGGKGIISVMSNVIPAACVKWTAGLKTNNWNEISLDFQKHKDFINSIYYEANPIPIKWMLYRMGIIKSPEMRLPLMSLDKSFHEKTELQLKSLGLI